ncbi:MAG: ABC transporter permease [bacterium (Candidatus Stahlbacteria) CG08_land_8_20_14_0_20_40_26]|nr:MAG: ABC transporter permease [bacterium (Candidatus Stahlbacteria) CG23_combo_of_CG06-09_8_20_14_all_40_9]PIS25860.1 MAG: ABC transporter permease [bacterium (Candidatus Stahlbacteria) CG08_land_8_20_14_0_20_40_26]
MSKKLIIYIILTVGTILSLLPFYWMIATSLKTPIEAVQFPPTWYPTHPRPENYTEAWRTAPFGRYFLNTVFIALTTLVGVIITSALAAYAFARMEFRGREVIFTLFLGMMMVPMPVYIVPGYLILASFKWVDTYYALIIPWMVNVFSIFLLRQHFRIIPKALYDAATVDGCSELGFLWKIAMPLSKPAIATISIFSLLASWNSFIWPLVMTNRDTIRPVQVGLAYFIQEQSTNYTLLSAASTFVILPVVILFFFFQRQIIESHMKSGIKE